MLNNVYYWSTNQVIVQRALGSKSLAEGQKGVMMAGAMKIVTPLVLCLPGTLAVLMIKNRVLINGQPFQVQNPDEVAPVHPRRPMRRCNTCNSTPLPFSYGEPRPAAA